MRQIYVVGMGPGNGAGMTGEAWEVLRRCDVIVGYTVYTDLMRRELPRKEYLETPMRQEVKRCRMAFEEARKGKCTAVICSGDAGVYGMSGLMLELGAEYPDCEIVVVAGVTAALAGAAALGAPLMHDFAVISLSDLLTPWELIEKRLCMAAKSDMVICLYNPSSKHRPKHLERACNILMEELPPERVCGFVRNAGRDGQETRILTLGELKNTQVDMFTTVFIGNSRTMQRGIHMVTPRGYDLK